MSRLDHYWQSLNPVSLGLLPLSWLFGGVAALRRHAYCRGWLNPQRLPVPVIVIGNISVGGSGKTPLVVWCARYLRQLGYRPGILSRGYGGQAQSWPQPVTVESDPNIVGDEPLLIARQSGCPLWVGPDRVAAGRALLDRHECDLLLSDDGLQHYALARDLEIAAIDGNRRLGNGLLLPAGPLREPPSRLNQIPLKVAKHQALSGEFLMQYLPDQLRSLRAPEQERPLEALLGQPVHALAGIAHPQGFFDLLRKAGLEIIEHPFPDHHPLTVQDLAIAGEAPLVMTEKDAVKCQPFAGPNHWYLPIEAVLPDSFGEALAQAVLRLFSKPSSNPGETHG